MSKPSLNDLIPCQLLLDKFEKTLKLRGNSPELPLLTMPDISFKLWGVHKQKLLLIGARTSNGKTNMAVNIAYDLAMQGKFVLYLSLELTVSRLMERLFCLDQKVDNIELLKNGYNNNEEIKQKYFKFRCNMQKTKLMLSDCIGKDWAFIDSIIDVAQNKPDIIILDHINEIKTNSEQRMAIDNHIIKMRESAIRNNYAIVVCVQVNRVSQSENDNKEPSLHHLKGSGFLEEAADQVMLLHWGWHYDNSKNKRELVVNVAKNRDAMTGRVKMCYSPEHCMIRDWEEPEEYKTSAKKGNNFNEQD